MRKHLALGELVDDLLLVRAELCAHVPLDIQGLHANANAPTAKLGYRHGRQILQIVLRRDIGRQALKGLLRSTKQLCRSDLLASSYTFHSWLK